MNADPCGSGSTALEEKNKFRGLPYKSNGFETIQANDDDKKIYYDGRSREVEPNSA